MKTMTKVLKVGVLLVTIIFIGYLSKAGFQEYQVLNTTTNKLKVAQFIEVYGKDNATGKGLTLSGENSSTGKGPELSREDGSTWKEPELSGKYKATGEISEVSREYNATEKEPDVRGDNIATGKGPRGNHSDTLVLKNNITELSNGYLYLNPKVKRRFEQRLEHITEVCKRHVISDNDNQTFVHQMRDDWEKRSFAFGRVRWCSIPKVGSTFVKTTVKDRLDEWAKQHRTESKEHWTESKVVFVREPYARLVSGYLNKVLLTPYWWPSVGRNVMRGAGLLKKGDPWHKRCSAYATFKDFIKYVISSERTGVDRNAHFAPIHDQCGFCTNNFTFIGKMETYNEDLKYIFNATKLNISVNKSQQSPIEPNMHFVLLDASFIQSCTTNFKMMENVWFAYKIRGFIPKDLPLPVNESASSNTTIDQFRWLAESAYTEHRSTFDSHLQRTEMVSRLYQTIPMQDRLALKTILQKDFELFEYDPMPSYIFPEHSSGSDTKSKTFAKAKASTVS